MAAQGWNELAMEYAICCHRIGKHAEAIKANDAIISCPNAPKEIVETARKNKELSVAVLQKEGSV